MVLKVRHAWYDIMNRTICPAKYSVLHPIRRYATTRRAITRCGSKVVSTFTFAHSQNAGQAYLHELEIGLSWEVTPQTPQISVRSYSNK
jgi:hypothetical protein